MTWFVLRTSILRCSNYHGSGSKSILHVIPQLCLCLFVCLFVNALQWLVWRIISLIIDNQWITKQLINHLQSCNMCNQAPTLQLSLVISCPHIPLPRRFCLSPSRKILARNLHEFSFNYVSQESCNYLSTSPTLLMKSSSIMQVKTCKHAAHTYICRCMQFLLTIQALKAEKW